MLATVEEAVEELRRGRVIILVDDENRENEGDFVCASEFVTPEIINFMAKEGRGLICVSITKDIAERLNFQPMVYDNTSPHRTNFTVSVDAKEGISTGISAYDRALTIRKIIDENSKPSDFVRPGHVFPLVAREGGVLVRAGHTEGSVDLCKIAGLKPSAVICEIMKEDGSMARLPDLIKIAQNFNLKIVSIESIIKYRIKRESLVRKSAEAKIPTPYGTFTGQVWENIIDKSQNFAMVMGEEKIEPDVPVLVRVHSECLTGDVFFSLRCDCGEQLRKALEIIGKEGIGTLIYIRKESMEKDHEGRGIGLLNKIKAYKIQDDEGLDTVSANLKLGFPPDLRDYGIGAQIIRGIGIRKMRLLTNNPKKIVALKGYGLEVVETIPLKTQPNPINEKYLKAKKEKLGHII